MNRTLVNPWSWSAGMGFSQGEVVEGAQRTFYLAGQTAVDADGVPQHPGDMGRQLALALDNVETVLAAGGMSLADVVRLNYYSTDIDAHFANMTVVLDRLSAAGVSPPGTLLEVPRLALPGLMVEIEAVAMA